MLVVLVYCDDFVAKQENVDTLEYHDTIHNKITVYVQRFVANNGSFCAVFKPQSSK